MIIKLNHRKYLLVSLIITLTALPLAIAYDKEFLDKIIKSVSESYGRKAVVRFKKWCELIESNVDKKTLKKLTIVNDFINRAKRESDADNYGQEDYWATPLELLGRNRGDCEDLSVAKYFTLSMMGVSTDKLRITYVTALEFRQAHIVLAYYETPNADPLVMDSLKPEILPASMRSDLKPIYGFNSDFIWLTQRRGKELKVGMSGRFKQWDTLMTKIKQEIEHSE
ncbi:MAG: transglutaminase-like cysteine peptidase [Candidatus Brocadiales bacterium]|nr:transglutaminase-like cysteine peptidase [Candidatus Brocadiales bacterium]